jgi:HlyD family secretion protein
MMHISNLDAIEARVDVSENDVLRVNMGDTAEIELDAYPEKKFKGVVNQIANSARSTLTGQSEQVINFQVKILLLKNSYKELIENEGRRYPFLPGMSASVDIMTNKVMNIMAVPIQSVTTREDTSTVVRAEMVSSDNEIKKNNDSPDEVVFVIDDGEARYKKVTTGIQDDEFIAIRSGLMGQEQIITGPFSAISRMLKNGDPVEVVDKDKLFKKEEDN